MHGKTSYRELRRHYHFSIKLLSDYIYEKELEVDGKTSHREPSCPHRF